MKSFIVFTILTGWIFIFIPGSLSIQSSLNAQENEIEIEFKSKFEYESAFEFIRYSAYGVVLDKNDQPYLYTSSSELGLIAFDISDPKTPVPIDTFPIEAFSGLMPMNLFQHEQYLYVALGNFFSNPQQAGLAIIDLTDAPLLKLKSVWTSPDFHRGSAVVVADGTHAFLGAMEEGLLILDVSDKSDPWLVSSILPDPNFPEPPFGLSQPKARGLHLEGDMIYLCNDAKGFRIIDVTNKEQPIELSKHMNTELHASARPAYNDVVVLGNFAFITVDYCGLEVVDISEKNSPQTVEWFNLWDCNNLSWGNPGSWWDAHGHTNQLSLSGDSLLFVSGGESEVLVFDVSNPLETQLMGQYGQQDHSVSWGLDVRGKMIATANVHQGLSSPPLPYFSDWGGIQLLEWKREKSTHLNHHSISDVVALNIYPNPIFAGGKITFENLLDSSQKLHLYNSTGIPIGSMELHPRGKTTFNFGRYPAGLYLYRAESNGTIERGTFLVLE